MNKSLNHPDERQETQCLFCDIVSGTLPAQIVYQDEWCTAFRDIQPQAPVHVLIIPNTHVVNHAMATSQQLSAVMATAQAVAKQLAITDYRLVMNNGEGAGQSVFHMHLHLLAGRSFHWPPG